MNVKEKKQSLCTLVAAAFLLLVIIWLGIRFVEYNNTRYTLNHMDRFSRNESLGTYDEALPRFFSVAPKSDRAVLLLHGWSGAVNEFDLIYPLMELEGIPYYGPMLQGFGLDSLESLKTVRAKDWKREALNAYDLLAKTADKIDVIGHSNGGSLAVYVAMNRPVNKLILTGPNIIVTGEDVVYKRLLGTPVIGDAYTGLLPVFRKPIREGRSLPFDTLNISAAENTFAYPAVPTNSLIEIWKLQDEIDISKARFASLYLLYGEHDRSVDIAALKQMLDNKSVVYKSFSYPDSAHNLLEDNDKEQVARDIMEILKS